MSTLLPPGEVDGRVTAEGDRGVDDSGMLIGWGDDARLGELLPLAVGLGVPLFSRLFSALLCLDTGGLASWVSAS